MNDNVGIRNRISTRHNKKEGHIVHPSCVISINLCNVGKLAMERRVDWLRSRRLFCNFGSVCVQFLDPVFRLFKIQKSSRISGHHTANPPLPRLSCQYPSSRNGEVLPVYLNNHVALNLSLIALHDSWRDLKLRVRIVAKRNFVLFELFLCRLREQQVGSSVVPSLECPNEQ